ncbi:MAG TPA: hypothetical protein EYG74_07940 [Sulfurimonas autotrophica]|nr:hypothetical protein [Sulfurimonas autotrophica]
MHVQNLNSPTNAKEIIFTDTDFCLSLENIDRACSTYFENNTAIFLPYTRLDKTEIQKYFFKNNQILSIYTDDNNFSKVEVHARLIGQIHKDILEILLSMDKEYSQKNKTFSITTDIASITKIWKRNYGKKQWIINKIKEIMDCNINLYFKTCSGQHIDLKFSFISSSMTINGKYITVNFTKEYVYFMARTELLDYRQFIPDIVQLENDFTKAIVRFILKDNGLNTHFRINTILEKLNYKKLMSTIELSRELKILKSKKVQKILHDKFGIYLSNNNQTINFDINLVDKKRYFIKTKKLSA